MSTESIVIFGVLVVVVALGTIRRILRTSAQLRRIGPGEERDAIVASRWSLAGSVAMFLAIALGLRHQSVLTPGLWLLLGCGSSLVVVAGIRTRRLAASRRQTLLRATATSTALADRVEALELERARYQGPPVRVRVMSMGAMVVAAGTNLWILSMVRTPRLVVGFGAITVLTIGLLGWEIVKMLRGMKERDRIDAEIDALLGTDAGPPRRVEGLDTVP